MTNMLTQSSTVNTAVKVMSKSCKHKENLSIQGKQGVHVVKMQPVTELNSAMKSPGTHEEQLQAGDANRTQGPKIFGLTLNILQRYVSSSGSTSACVALRTKLTRISNLWGRGLSVEFGINFR